MPAKNIVKQYAPESFYHLYSRGVNKQLTFVDDKDYIVFISLFKRYLSKENSKNPSRHSYRNFSDQIELISYALMPNHIHLLVYQKNEKSIASFMRALMTSYSMYFNKTHKRVGPVFQSRYKGIIVTTDRYLEHISRYIHMNPKDWDTTDKTSLRYYTGTTPPDWLRPQRIMEVFDNDKSSYIQFMYDYKDQKISMDELKWELANNGDDL